MGVLGNQISIWALNMERMKQPNATKIASSPAVSPKIRSTAGVFGP
jgi:hypothetical protein